MKLSNYLYLLASITIARAQDDNPSGGELQGNELYDNMFDDILTTTTGTSFLDDSLTTITATCTSSLDDSTLKVSSGNKSILKYKILLWGFYFYN